MQYFLNSACVSLAWFEIALSLNLLTMFDEMGGCPVGKPWSTFCRQRALLHVNITYPLALSSGRRCECWLRRLVFPGCFPLIALAHRFGPFWTSIQISALDVTEIPRDLHFVSNLFTEQQVPHKRKASQGERGLNEGGCWISLRIEEFAGLRFWGRNCAVYTVSSEQWTASTFNQFLRGTDSRTRSCDGCLADKGRNSSINWDREGSVRLGLILRDPLAYFHWEVVLVCLASQSLVPKHSLVGCFKNLLSDWLREQVRRMIKVKTFIAALRAWSSLDQCRKWYSLFRENEQCNEWKLDVLTSEPWFPNTFVVYHYCEWCEHDMCILWEWYTCLRNL